jgi:hypothetical protein
MFTPFFFFKWNTFHAKMVFPICLFFSLSHVKKAYIPETLFIQISTGLGSKKSQAAMA